jgi:hypothetical protein
MKAMGPREPGGIGEDGQEVFSLQILIIGENLVDHHAGAKQFQKGLHRVAKPADAGFAMADGGVDRNARKWCIHRISLTNSRSNSSRVENELLYLGHRENPSHFLRSE